MYCVSESITQLSYAILDTFQIIAVISHVTPIVFKPRFRYLVYILWVENFYVR